MTSPSLERRVTDALRRLKDDILESEPPVDYFSDEPVKTPASPRWTTTSSYTSSSSSYTTVSPVVSTSQGSYPSSSSVSTCSTLFVGTYTAPGNQQRVPFAPDPAVIEIKPKLTIQCNYCACAAEPGSRLCSQCGAPLPIPKETKEKMSEKIWELVDELLQEDLCPPPP